MAVLPVSGIDVTVPVMYTVARFLQLIGLTIPLLAIAAQLFENISAAEMLKFLVVAVVLFLIGYLLQRYSGGGPS